MNSLLTEASLAWDLELKEREKVPTNYAPKSSLKVVESKTKPYVLKTVYPGYFTHPATSPEEYSKGIGFFVDSLTEANIPIVKYLPTKEGKYHQNIGGLWYVLYPYVTAIPFREMDQEIASTARVHTKMNRVLADLKPNQVELIRTRLYNPFLPSRNLNEFFIATSSKTNEEEALSLIKRILSVLPDVEYYRFPEQVCHKDIWPANVIYTPDGEVGAILDPDEIMYIPRIRDVVYAMWYFATFNAQGKEKLDFDEKNLRRKAGIYLDNYNSENLTKEEIQNMGKVAVRFHIEDLLSYLQHPGLPGDFKRVVQIKTKRIENTLSALEKRTLEF